MGSACLRVQMGRKRRRLSDNRGPWTLRALNLGQAALAIEEQTACPTRSLEGGGRGETGREFVQAHGVAAGVSPSQPLSEEDMPPFYRGRS